MATPLATRSEDARHNAPARSRRLCPWTSLLLLTITAAGCTGFDPLDQTPETINRSATDYANDATLLNVVRASLWEPLSFITVTGLDGTQQASTSLGLPSVIVGPGTPVSRNFTFGPNSLARSNQNTVHLSVVDDPASFAALLAPLNPALIGALIRQGYPRELLFFLFVDRLREVELGKDGSVSRVVEEWKNDPDLKRPCHRANDTNPQSEYDCFIARMGSLLTDGITAEIEATAIPTGRGLPLSKICFDPLTLVRPAFAGQAPPGNVTAENCESEPWLQGQSSTGTSGSSGSGNTIVASRDNALWVDLGAQGKILRISADANGKLTAGPPVDTPAPPKVPKTGPLVGFLFRQTITSPAGVRTQRVYEVLMRSTYGIYDYVGALLRDGTDIVNLFPANAGYGGIAHVLRGADVLQAGSDGCFADVTYRAVRYCVPNTADMFKRVFALLHQLQQLNTAPSNAPVTLTTVPAPAP